MTDHEEFTHVAYSDEAYYSEGLYHSISLLTLSVETAGQLREKLEDILNKSGISEFKWRKVKKRSKKYYFCAKKILDLVIDFGLKNKIRVDTIIWDSTKTIPGEDNKTIFQKMYYQLFKNVLRLRWQQAKSWKLFPDEQSNINWDEIKEFLDLASFDADTLTREGKRLLQLVKNFDIVEIEEVNSKKEVLSQIPDLFAGLAAFSRLSYLKYLKRHGTLFGQVRLTGSEQWRFRLLEYFNRCCKKHKLGVSLKSSEGLWSGIKKYPEFQLTLQE